MEPNIVYEDPHLLVIDKPPGLVVTRSETTTKETLEDWLEQKRHAELVSGPSLSVISNEMRDLKTNQEISRSARNDNMERMGIVHRLDKDTSGLILVAKTPEAFENLQKQFKERVVKKQYLALVHGWVEKGGKVEGSIGRNPGNREKFMVVSPGRSQSPPSRWPNGLLEGERWAVTEYEPVERLQLTGDRLQEIFPDFNKIQFRKLSTIHYNLFTFLVVRPKTGRTHQIRVHLKYAQFPIVSDEKYVGRKMYRLDHRWCPRQFLHAARVGFKHPVSGQWMEIESPLPEDLNAVLGKLTTKI